MPCLVLNTCVVEMVIAFAVFRFVVRRAEKKPRAVVLFVLGLLAVFFAQSAGGLEVLGPPIRRHRRLGRESTETVGVGFRWEATPILGRNEKPRMIIVCLHGCTDFVTGAELTDELWAFRDADDTPESLRRFLETLARSPTTSARLREAVMSIVSAR